MVITPLRLADPLSDCNPVTDEQITIDMFLVAVRVI